MMLKKDKLKLIQNEDSRFYSKLSVLGAVSAFVIIVLVLFSLPMPGVADQGDFERVMNVSGIVDIQNSPSSPEPHWYKYVTTKYKMAPLGAINSLRLTGIIPTTSMIYPIFTARLISKLLGGGFFSTKFLAAVYSIIYIVGLYMILRWVKIRNKATAIFFSVLSLIILVDGSYLIWFNSFYGEAMMTTGLMLFIGSALYTMNNLENLGYKAVIVVFISALFLLGAKLQCFVALPFMIYMVMRVALHQNKSGMRAILSKKVVLPILALIFYIGGIYIQINSGTGVDTEFNSVFYGVLKNSDDPEGDLKKLGLPVDMAAEAGKHAYLPKDAYAKYVPGTELTKREFNDKMSNSKLLLFYMKNPDKLLKGMEYTASKAFDTQGSLGKYEKVDVAEYTPSFDRFTLWSDFRSSKIPRSLSFIIPFYIAIILVSIMEYLRRKKDVVNCMRIEVLWVVMLIGLIQFPMPYTGNGEADTAKQLFLFNYTFDITFLVAVTWVFNKGLTFISKTSNKT